MGRRNRGPEGQERWAKIRKLLQLSGVSSMRIYRTCSKKQSRGLLRLHKVFKFPSVERGTYDRLKCNAKHQIYPLIGDKVVGDITPADIKGVLNHWMNGGYTYTTVKKV